MRRRARAGMAQLAGLVLAAALTVPFCAASAEATALSRRALHRVIAWHLAKGMAVEFALAGVTPSRGLSRTAVTDTYFVSQVLRFHPEYRRYLAPFVAEVKVAAGAVRSRVTWVDSGQRREMTEELDRRRP